MGVERNELLAVAASLALDSLAGELADQLRRAGVPAILLKGPATRRRLYGESERRPHEDIDLLVPPSETARVERLLGEQGFRFATASGHARAWIRREDGVTVDLHSTLVGIDPPADEAWKVLSQETEPMTVGRHEVSVLNEPGTALHLALHAAQHGVRGARSIEDLRRGLACFSSETWERAGALASELRAVPSFAAGLRLLPAGRVVADLLELPTRGAAETILRAASAPQTALGLHRLATTPGVRRKAAFVAEELIPPPTFMRAAYPWARRNRLFLALSYAWRPLWLARHVGPALQAWQRARRASRSG